MKAASQQRRTLSFKEGLLEIKKSMGKGSGQTPVEEPQAQADKPARKAPPAAPRKDARSRPQKPGARPQGGKPQQAGAASQDRRGKPGERPSQRQRPARAPQPAANLSEAERARIERNRQLNTVWNVFAKHYPAFRERLPLKIGVAEDLVARHAEYDRALIVAVLKRHVNHPRYHERVAAGGSRYELDGSVSAGPGIEPSHIGRANAALARQKAKAEARAKGGEEGKVAAQKGAEAPAAGEPVAAAAPVASVTPVEPVQAEPATQGVESPEGAEPPATGE